MTSLRSSKGGPFSRGDDTRVSPAGTDDEPAPSSIKTKGKIAEYVRGWFTSLCRAAARFDAERFVDGVHARDPARRLMDVYYLLTGCAAGWAPLSHHLRSTSMPAACD